jgi:uncharacterized membrane protein
METPRMFWRLVAWWSDSPLPVGYNDWRIVSRSDWPVALSLVWVALVLVAGLLAWRERSMVSTGSRMAVLTLRVLALTGILAMALKPVLELRMVSLRRNTVAVLLDASKSMSLPAGETTRLERVRQHIRDARTEYSEIEKGASLAWFKFGQTALRLDPSLELYQADAAKTDLRTSIQAVVAEVGADKLAGIILYSDGVDTEGLDAEAASRSSELLGIPVTTIGFETDRPVPDLAIEQVSREPFAFVHQTVRLQVDVTVQGLALGESTVSIRQAGAMVARAPVVLRDGRGRAELSFLANTLGRIAYTVEVPVQPSEVVSENNTRELVLNVVRDRIRVLQIAGRPSWDVRFLREFLKAEPKIDLISFFILRSPSDLQKARNDELALIPFPVRDLLTTELGSFDVVIYQNFGFAPYRMAQFLPNLRRYVLDGGAFVMIGGNESFADGDYAGTAVEDILPVALNGAPRWDASEYLAEVAPHADRHPVLEPGPSETSIRSTFSRLPKLQGWNGSSGLSPGAQALLNNPSVLDGSPVVAVREVGEGRSMAVLTDSTWLWYFASLGQERPSRAYHQFWRSALRWLTRDPALERVRVRATKPVFQRLDVPQVEVEVLGSDYQPASGVSLAVTLRSVAEKAPSMHQVIETTHEGPNIVPLPGLGVGVYSLEIEASDARGRIGGASIPIVVSGTEPELFSMGPKTAILRALSGASGGRFVTVEQPLPSMNLKPAQVLDLGPQGEISLWNTWLLFGLLLVLFAGEWWLRRKSGLL